MVERERQRRDRATHRDGGALEDGIEHDRGCMKHPECRIDRDRRRDGDPLPAEQSAQRREDLESGLPIEPRAVPDADTFVPRSR